jgi:RNA polymerase sigma-70 factor, ECF subfamily
VIVVELAVGTNLMFARVASDARTTAVDAVTVPALAATTGLTDRPAEPVSIEPTDESLVIRLRDGDSGAGDVLVKRYHPALIRYLHRLSGSDHMAEELHQLTWVSVLDHIERFDPTSSAGGFKAWLFRIATNKTNDHWRSRGRERAAKDGLKLVTEKEVASSDDRLESTEEQEKLKRVIQMLPDAQRQVLMLRYYSNLKFVEIAQMLGIPLNTALGRMHKATQKLKALMEQ